MTRRSKLQQWKLIARTNVKRLGSPSSSEKIARICAWDWDPNGMDLQCEMKICSWTSPRAGDVSIVEQHERNFSYDDDLLDKHDLSFDFTSCVSFFSLCSRLHRLRSFTFYRNLAYTQFCSSSSSSSWTFFFFVSFPFLIESFSPCLLISSTSGEFSLRNQMILMAVVLLHSSRFRSRRELRLCMFGSLRPKYRKVSWTFIIVGSYILPSPFYGCLA